MDPISMMKWGDLEAVRLRAGDGAEAVVTLYGAHLVSWRGADGVERLFCSARSARDGSRAIRGGVPLIFPQFNERGDGMRHGFARVSQWRLAADPSADNADGVARARFTLAPSDLAPALARAWPHAFALEFELALHANELTMTLAVRNDDTTPFAFSCALHSYLLLDQVDAVRIEGVQAAPLAVGAAIDQVFYAIDGPIRLGTGAGALELEQSGFVDAVVWNPGAAGAAALVDMEAAEYRRFVCIEPAVIEARTLAPGGAWRGRHRLVARPA
jgi:glucose-6-phosphate 1-epimerase